MSAPWPRTRAPVSGFAAGLAEPGSHLGVPDAAAQNDDIEQTIRYDAVIERIRAELAARHFNPAWEPRTSRTAKPAPEHPAPARCLVIGAGLAGAATAASLARRGWQVQVLDAATAPAGGASGLPLGLFAPHLSPDDNVFSRVSRSGVRAMLQQSQALLQPGLDWNPDGVLERRPPDNLGLPVGWEHSPGADWSLAASPPTACSW